MEHITNQQIAAVLTGAEAFAALRDAYLDLHHGRAAIQPRSRIAVPDAKFSTMAALLATHRVAVVKMYTTLDGQFRFHLAVLSLDDGRMLALMEGDELTRVRTAATTALAAAHLARPDSRTLGIVGSGVQARAHADALIDLRDGLSEVWVHSPNPENADAFAASLTARHGVHARAVTAEHAASADIVVLATRASTPVIQGAWLREGAFLASVGATRPEQREMDDACIARADTVVVDWIHQTPVESGDFTLLAPAICAGKTLIDLADVIAAGTTRAAGDTGIVVYKAVGNALQDAAVAALAYRKHGH
jgi:ornithine cyclodeaminase